MMHIETILRQVRFGTLALMLGTVASMVPGVAGAEQLKVLTAGAFKQVLLGIVPQFEQSGHTVQLDADTVGALVKRIQGGESFDLVIASPAALDTLRKAGIVTAKATDLARVGVGVGIREGAAKPDLSTVEGFKRALLDAKAVAYIDPAAGGTSGIYIASLLDKLGIGPQVKAKSVLVKGGYSADRIASGEADIAIQQISEIMPVKGVVLAGPLPADIQNYTTYSAGIAAHTANTAAATALIDLIRGGKGEAIIRGRGMEPAL